MLVRKHALFRDSREGQNETLMMASRKIQGRPRESRGTMSAGIVLAHHATLATRNIRDFGDILATLVDPWNVSV